MPIFMPGTIDEKEAQRRRRELEEESAFFGSMDGASKFVRGDAIAGLIILAVNIFGGIVIGATRHNMPLSQAADVFTKLSVGDGLVTQIPALIVSLAAGLLVSKGGTRGSAEQAVFGQLVKYPNALFVAAVLMFVSAAACRACRFFRLPCSAASWPLPPMQFRLGSPANRRRNVPGRGRPNSGPRRRPKNPSRNR